MGDNIFGKGLQAFGDLGTGFSDPVGAQKMINERNKNAADKAATGNLIAAYEPLATKLGVAPGVLQSMPTDSIPAFIGNMQRDQAAGVTQPIAIAGEGREVAKVEKKTAQDIAREESLRKNLHLLSAGDRILIETKLAGGDAAGAETIFQKSPETLLSADMNAGINPGSESDIENHFKGFVGPKQAKARTKAFIKNRTQLKDASFKGQIKNILGGGERVLKGPPKSDLGNLIDTTTSTPPPKYTAEQIAAEKARRAAKKK